MAGESSTLIYSCLGALWTVLLALGGYGLKRISEKLDALIEHREACVRSFADKESNNKQHTEIYSHLRDHDSRISVVEYALKVKE